jgi:hypothetical protein
MFAVDEIDIGVTGRTKHDFGAGGQALGRMGCQVMWSKVGFGFHNFSDEPYTAGVTHEELAQQFLRDHPRVAVIKAAWKFLHGAPQTGAIPGLTEAKMSAKY